MRGEGQKPHRFFGSRLEGAKRLRYASHMLRKLLDLWLAPKTFRLLLSSFPLYAIIAVISLWERGIFPLLAWVGIIVAWWFEASLTVCRRCRHYGTWHCAGQGMLVSKVFSRRPPGLPRWRIVAHFLADAVVFFFPQPWIYWRFGLGVCAATWAYLLLLVVAAFPREGASYNSGRGGGFSA